MLDNLKKIYFHEFFIELNLKIKRKIPNCLMIELADTKLAETELAYTKLADTVLADTELANYQTYRYRVRRHGFFDGDLADNVSTSALAELAEKNP